MARVDHVFESRRSAKAAVMLCSLLRDPSLDNAGLRAELVAMAAEPLIARHLLRILALDWRLAACFGDVIAAARATLRDAGRDAPIGRDPPSARQRSRGR